MTNLDRSASRGRPSRYTSDVSVIIVNWNLREMLSGCIDAILKSENALDIEIIVVDNASTDGSAEMLKEKYPQVILIENEENVGFAQANNQALGIGSGRYFLLLNNDAILIDNALQRLVEYMDTRPKVGLCGPRIENPDGSMQVRTKGRFPSIPTALAHFFLPASLQHHGRRTLGFYEMKDDMVTRAVDWLSGCALLARHDAVDDVGLLDSGVFMYCEDVDWCRRMQTEGWGADYLPQARVLHYQGQSMKKQTGKKVGAHKDGLISFYSKYHSRLATAIFISVLWLGYGSHAIGWLVGHPFGRKGGIEKFRRFVSNRRLGSDS